MVVLQVCPAVSPAADQCGAGARLPPPLPPGPRVHTRAPPALPPAQPPGAGLVQCHEREYLRQQEGGHQLCCEHYAGRQPAQASHARWGCFPGCRSRSEFLWSVFRNRDPMPFLPRGSGIRNRVFFVIPDPQISDPGSQTHIFESLVTISEGIFLHFMIFSLEYRNCNLNDVQSF